MVQGRPRVAILLLTEAAARPMDTQAPLLRHRPLAVKREVMTGRACFLKESRLRHLVLRPVSVTSETACME